MCLYTDARKKDRQQMKQKSSSRYKCEKSKKYLTTQNDSGEDIKIKYFRN